MRQEWAPEPPALGGSELPGPFQPSDCWSRRREGGKPFAFLGLYHEAALLRQAPEAPPLSEAALRVIRGLEGKSEKK